MNSYQIKINGKFIKDFEDTNIPQKFRGEWNNHTKQTVVKPIYGKESDSKIIEGNRNLKSNFDMIFHILQDGIYEVKKIEIIKKENSR
jgi:hypothetical protein